MTSLITGDLRHRRALYVGGKWAHGGGPLLRTVSPVTEQNHGSCVTAAPADIDAAVAAARRALHDPGRAWQHVGARVACLDRLREVYALNMWVMHRLVCAQNGSLGTYTTQVTDPLEIMRQTAAFADSLGPTVRHNSTEANPPFDVYHEPVGVVAAITGWDMPQKAMIAKLAPALAAGCPVIIIPSPYTPLDALYLADMAHTIGLPPGMLSVLPVARDPKLFEYVVTHPGVDLVTFTGSAATGARVAALRAGLGLRRVAVQCAGRSAAIIAEDADLPDAVQSLRALALGDSGQLRCAVARLVVHKSVAGEFAERMRVMMRGLQVGDPALAETDIGPLVSAEHRRRVRELIKDGHTRGLRMLTGMKVPEGPGFYVYPTLFTDVAPDAMPAAHDVFGPVLTITTFRDDDHAVALANGSRPGLAAAVYCADPARARRLAMRLHASTVHINGALPAVRAPMGAFRPGGVGREVGPEGIAGYQHLKAVVG